MDTTKTSPVTESRLHFLDIWRIIRIRKTVVITVFLLVVLTATAITYMLPPIYAGVVKIRVDKDIPDIQPIADQTAIPLGTYDPYFIQTEYEVIQSQVVLERVIKDLKLDEVWGKKYGRGPLSMDKTLELLRKRLSVRPSRQASTIEIRVFSEDKNEAALLANRVAEAYRDYRVAEREKRMRRALEILKAQYEEHEAKIRKVQEELDRLRAELGITDPEATSTQPAPLLTQETLRRLETLRIEAEAKYTGLEKLLTSLKPLSKEELRKVLPTASPDALLSSYLEQLANAEQRLVLLRRDYGPNHPEVVKVTEQIQDLNKKIDERIEGILKGLQTQVESAKAQVEKLKEEVEKARQADIAEVEKSRPYFDKKRELDELIRFRTILAYRIAAENTNVNLPKTAVVEILERATPSDDPVRPNKPVNIALGIIFGLLIGVGLAFFIEYLDTSVKTIEDVERSLQAPVLGVIPQNVKLLINEGADSGYAEAYRIVRTNLLFSRKDERFNTICVVSAGAGEGKSTTVINLAVTFALAGDRVLLVDSDFRRPSLHKLLGVSNKIGLTDLLFREKKLDDVIVHTKLETLDFIPSGRISTSALGLLNSNQMKSLISELKRRYDYVFFDSPPIIGVSDAAILASEVDMTIQVIQYRRYPQPMYLRAKQIIEKVGGNLVGIVLNNINIAQDESYYYYSGYYHDYYYYYSRHDEEESKEPSSEKSPKTEKSGGMEGLETKY